MMQQRNDNAPVLILAGGTGGHIFPGLALANVLQARDVPVRWMGAEGAMETRLVPQHGIALDTLQISGLRGKGMKALLGAPFKLLRAIRHARRVLQQLQPRAVVSFGGFASGPGGVAARLLGVPLLVHEQNRAAGLTNRVLAKFATQVLTGFPDTFVGVREQLIGNPVRAEILAIAEPAQRFAGRDNSVLRVLVLGGSQGARALNQALPKALQPFASGAVQVRHQSGQQLFEETKQSYAQAGVQADIRPFIADMAESYAWADVVVCRAGALTLAELCAAGVGSLLVPFPQAVDDHQTRNALYLVEHGAARLHPQHDDLAATLTQSLQQLASDAGLRLAMAQAARKLARPHAADALADAVLASAKQQEKAT